MFVLVPIIEQVPICIIHKTTLDNAARDSLILTKVTTELKDAETAA